MRQRSWFLGCLDLRLVSTWKCEAKELSGVEILGAWLRKGYKALPGEAPSILELVEGCGKAGGDNSKPIGLGIEGGGVTVGCIREYEILLLP